MTVRILVLFILTLALTAAAQTAKILIFSATTSYRHASIPYAIAAMGSAGPTFNQEFYDTEDPAQFNDENLAQYDAILFLSVTDLSPASDIINPAQQQAFQRYLDKGGNFIGIHAATVCLYNVPFYGKEIGAYFDNHPTIAENTFLNNIDPTHPIVSMIPPRWTYEEEVYSFTSDPRSVGATVILTVDETATGGDHDASAEGTPHPIVWYQERGAGASANASSVGRSFYTALGHLPSTWQDPIFIDHVMAGITWTLASNTTKAFNSSGLVGNAAGAWTPSSSSSSSGSLTSSPSPTQARKTGAGSISSTIAWGAVLAAAVAPFLLFGAP